MIFSPTTKPDSEWEHRSRYRRDAETFAVTLGITSDGSTARNLASLLERVRSETFERAQQCTAPSWWWRLRQKVRIRNIPEARNWAGCVGYITAIHTSGDESGDYAMVEFSPGPVNGGGSRWALRVLESAEEACTDYPRIRVDLSADRLRGMVIALVKSMVPHPTEHPTMHAAWTKAKALLDEDPCEPKDACLEHGRCWAHSDESPSETDIASENARAFLAKMADRGVSHIEDDALRYHLALLLKRCSETASPAKEQDPK